MPSTLVRRLTCDPSSWSTTFIIPDGLTLLHLYGSQEACMPATQWTGVVAAEALEASLSLHVKVDVRLATPALSWP